LPDTLSRRLGRWAEREEPSVDGRACRSPGLTNKGERSDDMSPVVEFSPTAELQKTLDVVSKNMEAGVGG
jgi:hypothetical protein